jgi:hypothetical protein
VTIQPRIYPVRPDLEGYTAAVGKRVGLGHRLLFDGVLVLEQSEMWL